MFLRALCGFRCATLLLAALVFLTSCGGKKQSHVQVPPAPPLPTPAPEVATRPAPLPSQKKVPQESLSVPPGARPIFTETGIASWYGPPYHNRRGSNGQIYDMNAMTAAHRTLPLGSIVRVTNIKSGHSALVRITDRGPFVSGRILDLSLAAAKVVDVWQAGLATVRIEVLETPSTLEGGRWAVQIGAFHQEDEARDLSDHISRRYHSAKVLCFSSPVGDWWVRVRVLDDDRTRAEDVAHTTQTRAGSIFLVRLD